MPLWHQAQRKTQGSLNVRPPWGGSGCSKSVAMVPKGESKTPPTKQTKSGLSRREANVPVKASPAKPNAQPRVPSHQKARAVRTEGDKENPTKSSTPIAPAIPITHTPTRSPPFAAPFTDTVEHEDQAKDGIVVVQETTDSVSITPRSAPPPTPIGLGGVGATDASFTTPVRNPPSSEVDEKENEAETNCAYDTFDEQLVDKLVDACCDETCESFALETESKSDPVTVKIEMPSPEVEIGVPIEADISQSDPIAQSEEVDASVSPERNIEISELAACVTPSPVGRNTDPTSDEPFTFPVTPYTASRVAKSNAPTPHDLFNNGGDPTCDIETLSKAGGVLHALFRTDETKPKNDAVVFANTLASLASDELTSVRAQLRATRDDHVDKKEALRAVADRAADWLRALHPAFVAIANDLIDKTLRLDVMGKSLSALEETRAANATAALVREENSKRAIAAARAEAEAEALSASAVEQTARTFEAAKKTAETLVAKQVAEISGLKEDLKNALHQAAACKSDVNSTLDASIAATAEAERDSARRARAARRNEVNSLKVRAKKAEKALIEERDRLAVCLASLEAAESSLDEAHERAGVRERDACAAEARAEAWRRESEDQRKEFNDLFDDLRAQVTNARSETEQMKQVVETSKQEAADAQTYASRLRKETKKLQKEKDEALAIGIIPLRSPRADAAVVDAAVEKIVSAHDAVASETLEGLEKTVCELRQTLRNRDRELGDANDMAKHSAESSKRLQQELKNSVRDAAHASEALKAAKLETDELRSALRDARVASETVRRDYDASLSESTRARTQREAFGEQVSRLESRVTRAEARCSTAESEAATAKAALDGFRVAAATELDAERVSNRRRQVTAAEEEGALRRALTYAESELQKLKLRAQRAETQSADVMTKSVEMLEDAKQRVRAAEAKAREAVLLKVGSSASGGFESRPPVHVRYPETLNPERMAVPPIVTAAVAVAMPPPAPVPTAAPFVPTWSSDVSFGTSCTEPWTPSLKGVKTPARRAMFVEKLVGNIDAL